MRKYRVVVCAVLVLLGLLSVWRRDPWQKKPAAELESRIALEVSASEKKSRTEPDEDSVDERQNVRREKLSKKARYESPVDFEALQSTNPDIFGWLSIPGTDISYPLVQREGDDSFYLSHNSAGKKDKNGALFTESAYNNRDFSDPATVVYGHHMRSGAMFGRLQELYSGDGGMEAYREILVYLPAGEIRYEVFAAVPFSSDHILYYHNFDQESGRRAFLDRIRSVRSLGAVLDKSRPVSPGARLLILSTCLAGNNKKRFLVLAAEAEGS